MRSMRTTRSASRDKKGKNQVSEVEREVQVAPGEVIFVKLSGSSWWPGQVVDENNVHESAKPRRRSAKEVLVRLYGSYTYSYADPAKSRSEFERILDRNDGSCRQILLASLEKVLPSTKSSGSNASPSKASPSKASSSKTKGTPSKSPASKRQKQNDDDLDCQSHEPSSSAGKSQELSARRLRVMQTLGLIGPPDSPFQRDLHS